MYRNLGSPSLSHNLGAPCPLSRDYETVENNARCGPKLQDTLHYNTGYNYKIIYIKTLYPIYYYFTFKKRVI